MKTVAEILAEVAQLGPLLFGLLDRFEKIKTQTEAEHPEVWAAISDDFKTAIARRNAMLGG